MIKIDLREDRYYELFKDVLIWQIQRLIAIWTHNTLKLVKIKIV